MERIEILERYILESSEEVDWWNENMPTPFKPTYRYRRTNPLISDIERFIEIPKNKEECICKFYWGEEIVIKANFDEMCIKLNDWENNDNEEG